MGTYELHDFYISSNFLYVCTVFIYCDPSSAAVDVGPELQVMIKEQQDKLRKEYETKLAGLVRTTKHIHMHRYKVLETQKHNISSSADSTNVTVHMYVYRKGSGKRLKKKRRRWTDTSSCF